VYTRYRGTSAKYVVGSIYASTINAVISVKSVVEIASVTVAGVK